MALKFLKVTSKSVSTKAIIALVFAYIIWGLSTPINKLAIDQVDVYFFVGSRFTLAAFLVAPWGIERLKNIKRKLILKTVINCLYTAVAILLFYIALDLIPSTNASVLSAFAPLVTFLLAVVLLKEPLNFKKIFGACLGLLGLIVIVIEPVLEGNGFSLQFAGSLLLVFAITLGAVGSITKKPLLKQIDAMTVGFIAFIITATVAWIAFFARSGSFINEVQNINTTVAVGLAFSVLLATIAAFNLFYFALNNLYAEDIAVFSYIDPIVGVLGAALLIGETLSNYFVAGSMLILMGIYLSESHIHAHKHKLNIFNRPHR